MNNRNFSFSSGFLNYVDLSGDGSNFSAIFSSSSSSITTTTSSTTSSLSPESCKSVRGGRKLDPPDIECTTVCINDEIKKSYESGECDLSQLQLFYVPTCLPFDFLVTLILSCNRLTELPEDLFERGQCRNLVKLDVQSNQLTTIPRCLLTLPKLEVLLLDYNHITYLPFEAIDEKNEILPTLMFVGLEFNELRQFPVEFFMYCSHVEEILLGQNLTMLENPLPTDQLLQSPLAQRLVNSNNDSKKNFVILKIDNRPCYVKQIVEENWGTLLPWIKIQFHKIYPDKILGFMYIGSLRTAQTKTVYRDLNIGYILTVARDVGVEVDEGMKHLVLPVDDMPGENIRRLLTDAFNFVDEARREGKCVLLHCFSGISRSVTVATAYIMSRYSMTRDEALNLIKQARPAAQPNPGFMITLAEFEEDLKQKGILNNNNDDTNGNNSNNNNDQLANV